MQQARVKYYMQRKQGIFLFFFFAFHFLLFTFHLITSVHAASLALTPAILDYKAKARDIIDEAITIKNLEARQVSLYPVVDNVQAQNGSESFIDQSVADLSASLANWILFSRAAIILSPSESRTIPLQIRVDLTAKFGTYHAIVAFPEGPTRYEAEQHLASAPSAAVNMEVQEDIQENVQLKKFAADKNFFWGLPASFTYQLQNSGNRAETPQGKIFIYDNRGKEVAAIPANQGASAVDPGALKSFFDAWNMGSGFGQYRALLSLSYGNESAPRIQDTVFFWVLPWQKVAGIVMTLFIVCMGLALWLHRRYARATVLAHAHHPISNEPAHVFLADGHSPHVVDLRHPPGKEHEAKKLRSNTVL